MSGGWSPQLKTVSQNVNEEAEFLASEHIMAKRVGVTLDSSTVGADADGNKILVKGTLLGKIAATGKYGAYDGTENDGRETAEGILFESINLKDGDQTAGMLLHGSVLEARVSGLDSSGKADLAGRIVFQ